MNKEIVYNDKIDLSTIPYKGKDYKVKYQHEPNFVRRSEFTKLPIVVGRTIGGIKIDDKHLTAEAHCWVNEPFIERNGELVVYGRLLKQLGLRLSKTSNKIVSR